MLLVIIVIVLLFGSFLRKKQELKTKQLSKDEETTFVDQLLSEYHFAGVVLLIKNEAVYYERAYGYANEELKQKNAETMAYPVASVQKSMTAIMIEQLVSEGKLSYDETVEQFYPTLTRGAHMTIRDLLNHSSGIIMDEIEPDTLLTSQKEQLDFVLSEMTVSNNQTFTYTNANYTLLAGILSMITGKSYEELFTEKISTPLNLKQTYFWDQLPNNQTIPLGYMYDEVNETDYQAAWASFPESQPLFSSLLGAGNLFMSAGDLWKVQKAMENGEILSEKMYNEMTAVVTSGYSSGFWFSGDLKISSGSLGGYNTCVYGDKKNQTRVILISNQQGTTDTGSLAEMIYERLH
ncbi:hypothetical protein IGI37_001945 [Enterococcus sp. AZ194]